MSIAAIIEKPKLLRPAEPYISPSGEKKSRYIFLCHCGKEFRSDRSNVNAGHTTGCGCKRTAGQIARLTTHGLSKHPLYRIWGSMKGRCYDKNSPNYPNYGGRGICVSDEWITSFKTFKEDMERGYEKGLQLDRIDNNKGYGKENCRWVTSRENNNNTRRNVYIEHMGERKTIAQWCRINGLNITAVCNRLKKGWNEIDAITIPIRKKIKSSILLLLLISSVTYGQKKSTESPRFRLLAFNLKHKPKPVMGSDTVRVNLVTTHKIKKYAPSQTIGGYAIRSGSGVRYVDCEYKPLPMYIVIRRVLSVED